MRQHFKNQCIDTLSLLLEAHSEIENCIRAQQMDAAMELLEECQQGAVGIGNLIEETEGEGNYEVSLLEKYCEMIWQISEKLHDSENFDLTETKNNLLNIVENIKKGIIERIPLSREIVFMPYKASMWDSLEPVWRKLSAENDIRTVVMPIPYFDKNPDGTPRKLHYEGDLFPKDVEITDYRSYSLEERHPEAIYIHNPYDGMNYVTSVHPDYYSSVIKNFTDELVYIPYFVLGEINPNDRGACEGIKHFVVVPGVIHAHKVIVQSEDMRQAYINIMTDFIGEDSRGYWENKIDGSGSPKFERVDNLTSADHEIPPEWKEIIEKEDGSRRKIIFYNTSVAAFLQNKDVMLDKIKRVLEIFKENRGEIALLWRPHPLMEATVRSMHPELWDEYSRIVEKYKEEKWGIYDDTAELDRAIAISDAYYGDASSVVNLYQKTGKPVMIQNVAV